MGSECLCATSQRSGHTFSLRPGQARAPAVTAQLTLGNLLVSELCTSFLLSVLKLKSRKNKAKDPM